MSRYKPRDKPALCSVRGCVNSSKFTMTYNLPGSDVTLHKFPSDAFMNLQWANAIGRPDVLGKRHKILCSLHFAENTIVWCKKRKRILPDAVPTIFEIEPKALNARKGKRKKKTENSNVDNIIADGVLEEGEEIMSTQSPPKKRRRRRTKKELEIANCEIHKKNNSFESAQETGSNVDDENDAGIHTSGNSRRSSRGSGNLIGEYISESNVSYISTSGKRSHPMQSIVHHQSPSDTHNPWGADYDASQYVPQFQSPQNKKCKINQSSPRKQLTNKKKVRQNNPAQKSLRELREQQNQQLQFSLMSFAPIEIDQSTSFAAPADDEILQYPFENDHQPHQDEQEKVAPQIPERKSVDPNITAQVYLQQLHLMEEKIKTEKLRIQTLRKSSCLKFMSNKTYNEKVSKLLTTIKKFKKDCTMPAFNLEDKNIKVTIT